MPYQGVSQPKDETQIISIEASHFAELVELLNDAFGSKRCLGLFPATETVQTFESRRSKDPPQKQKLGAVAVDSNTKTVLGYVQMTCRGLPAHPEGLHTCEQDEMYIEQIAVAVKARGRGIGTRLLDWCEETAQEHGKTRLTLAVLRGNRAIGLYERFGFEGKDVSMAEDCCTSAFVCCFMGRPYGCCGECGAIDMVKTLD